MSPSHQFFQPKCYSLCYSGFQHLFYFLFICVSVQQLPSTQATVSLALDDIDTSLVSDDLTLDTSSLLKKVVCFFPHFIIFFVYQIFDTKIKDSYHFLFVWLLILHFFATYCTYTWLNLYLNLILRNVSTVIWLYHLRNVFVVVIHHAVSTACLFVDEGVTKSIQNIRYKSFLVGSLKSYNRKVVLILGELKKLVSKYV